MGGVPKDNENLKQMKMLNQNNENLNNGNALFAGEENNIALWRLAQASKESPLCLPAQVFDL